MVGDGGIGVSVGFGVGEGSAAGWFVGVGVAASSPKVLQEIIRNARSGNKPRAIRFFIISSKKWRRVDRIEGSSEKNAPPDVDLIALNIFFPLDWFKSPKFGGFRNPCKYPPNALPCVLNFP